MTTTTTTNDPSVEWSVEHAAELYRVAAWGQGYFAVAPSGNLVARPRKRQESQVDLSELVEGLRARGIRTPVLLRFPDLLDHRIGEIASAFATAIAENGYRGRYTAVYPVKVNQQREVVEHVFRCGAQHGFGLEVGSKPELLAAMGLTAAEPERPVICNGFKDDAFIEAVVLAKKLGRNIIPVVENVAELELIVKHARGYAVRPRLGVRVKLAAAGTGRWRHSAGQGSKFGLTTSQLLRAVDTLRQHGLLECLELLHCHIGSQIHDIGNVKQAVNELATVYTELVGLGAGLRYLDVGGGLGVDYDGSRSTVDSSMNYTLQEYAGDVVYRIANVCDNAGVPHPEIVTECGRAMVAYHSVLVFDVFGGGGGEPGMEVPDDLESTLDDEVPQPVFDLIDAYRSVATGSPVLAYHDASHAFDEAIQLFNLGYLSLPLRGLAERLYTATRRRILDVASGLEALPEELRGLEDELRVTYFGNFSLFQSVPDSWAVGQVFPVMPLQRLAEPPTRRVVIADLTCDSDGRIDRFQGAQGGKRALELHDLRPGESYYVGVFLVGAYQETLGDLHNLFGDPHVVHVVVDDDGRWTIEEVVEGDSTRQVLGFFRYDAARLSEEMRRDCESAVAGGRLTVDESRSLLRFYRSGLDGYTYHEPEGD